MSAAASFRPSRMLLGRILAPMMLVTLCACGAPPSVMLRIHGTPDDALVTINERYIDKLGRVQKRGVKLPPGEYRLTIEQVGFFPYDELIRIETDKPRTIDVQLQPIPD